MTTLSSEELLDAIRDALHSGIPGLEKEVDSPAASTRVIHDTFETIDVTHDSPISQEAIDELHRKVRGLVDTVLTVAHLENASLHAASTDEDALQV